MVYENAPRMRERFAKLGLGCNPLSLSCVPHDVPDDLSKWCLRVYSWYQLKHHVAKLQEYKARRQTCKLGEPSLQRRFKTRRETFILRVKLFGHWSDVQRVPVSQAEAKQICNKARCSGPAQESCALVILLYNAGMWSNGHPFEWIQ